jgi:hypothetical protein
MNNFQFPREDFLVSEYIVECPMKVLLYLYLCIHSAAYTKFQTAAAFVVDRLKVKFALEQAMKATGGVEV